MLLGMVSLWLSLWLNQRAAVFGRGDQRKSPRPTEVAVGWDRPHMDTAKSVLPKRLKIAHRIALGLGIVYLAVVAEISGSLHHSPLLADVSHCNSPCSSPESYSSPGASARVAFVALPLVPNHLIINAGQT